MAKSPSYRRKIDAYGSRLLMIIKGLFRRYERWNPVHPTLGAFWGMGIGVGCGVGWGPGFGPEVIGYVGAGCGIGFSVGFTLAGVGIGLPTNGVIRIPHEGILNPNGALGLSRADAFSTMKIMAGNSWNSVCPHLSFMKREACRLPIFMTDILSSQQFELIKLKKNHNDAYRINVGIYRSLWMSVRSPWKR